MVKKANNLVTELAQMNFKAVGTAKAQSAGKEFEKTMKAATQNSAQKDEAVSTNRGTETKEQTVSSGKEKKVDDAIRQMQSSSKKEEFSSEPEEITEDMTLLAAVQTVIADIKQQLMELFDISGEELTAAMEELGIGDEDLLSPQTLTKLAMQVSETENPTDLLFHSEFTGFLKEVQQSLNELEKEAEKAGTDLKQIGEEISQKGSEEVLPVQEEGKEVAGQEKAGILETTDKKEENGLQPEQQTMQTAQKETVQVTISAKNNTKQESQTKEEPQNLHAQVLTKLEEVIGEKLPEIDAQDVVRQVVEEIKLTVKADTSSFEMQLNPEHLGKINLQVAAKNGVVTAQIATETVEAKEILEAQISTLKETLNHQGIKVEAVEVSVGARGFEQNLDGQAESSHQQAGQEKQRRFRYEDLLGAEEGELTSAQQIAREIMMANGNRIDYSA